MGLFSFVKSAGRKVGLFGGDEAEEAEQVAAATKNADNKKQIHEGFARKLEAVVQDLGIPVVGLQVKYQPYTATVLGTARTQADREKAILAIGNTMGVAEVDDQMQVENPEPAAVFHTVQKGDTLSKISLANYGVIHAYDVIFEANKPMLEHPDEIFPGQVLRIPSVTKVQHTVKSGETLGTIAKHWYGNAARYTDIFEANREVIKDPDLIYPGQKIRIPQQG